MAGTPGTRGTRRCGSSASHGRYGPAPATPSLSRDPRLCPASARRGAGSTRVGGATSTRPLVTATLVSTANPSPLPTTLVFVPPVLVEARAPRELAGQRPPRASGHGDPRLCPASARRGAGSTRVGGATSTASLWPRRPSSLPRWCTLRRRFHASWRGNVHRERLATATLVFVPPVLVAASVPRELAGQRPPAPSPWRPSSPPQTVHFARDPRLCPASARGGVGSTRVSGATSTRPLAMATLVSTANRSLCPRPSSLSRQCTWRRRFHAS